MSQISISWSQLTPSSKPERNLRFLNSKFPLKEDFHARALLLFYQIMFARPRPSVLTAKNPLNIAFLSRNFTFVDLVHNSELARHFPECVKSTQNLVLQNLSARSTQNLKPLQAAKPHKHAALAVHATFPFLQNKTPCPPDFTLNRRPLACYPKMLISHGMNLD